DVVGRSGFLENTNVPANDPGPAEARQQIVRVQNVRRVQQPIAAVRAGLDVVTQGPQLLDARPNGRPADAELLRQVRARNAVARRAQRAENLGVDGRSAPGFEMQVHGSKSKAMSAARAECVSAPTEMQSTPVSAIWRTLARFTLPLASVLARPLACCTARRNCSRFMLSSRMMSAPAATACATCSSVSASTSILC